jgi:hypothetical protein
VENCRNVNREFPSRDTLRKSNFVQQKQIAQDSKQMVARFDLMAASIEERLGKFVLDLSNISSRLGRLDDKMVKTNDKLSSLIPSRLPLTVYS